MQEQQSSSPVRAPTSLHQPPRRRSPPSKRRRTSSSPYSSSRSPPSASPPSPSQSPSPSPLAPPHPPLAPAIPAITVTNTTPPSAKWFRKPSVVWYRGHDMRVEDHPALLAAAQRGGPVVPLFVWDPSDGFGAGMGHVKQWWLRESLNRLEHDLQRLGVQLYTRTGRSADELRDFLAETGADAVFWNRCYEPDLLTRDEELRVELAQEGFTAESFKAELLVEPWELSNSDCSPCFDTFHAYMRAWMTVPPPPQPFPCPSRLQPITRTILSIGIDSLRFDIPAKVQELMARTWIPGSKQAKIQLQKFLHEVFPAFGEGRCRRHVDGTSRLSPHIRFGELSPRRMYHATRLRVSRWDRSSLLQRIGSNQVRKPDRTHPDSFIRRENARFPSRDISENMFESRKRPRASEEKATAVVGEGTALVGDTDHRFSGAENRGGVRLKRGTKTDPEHTRRPSSALYKKLSLPHISLSARAFLKNLCLRDFSYHVLFHNPECATKPLVPQFTSFPWAEDNGTFESWRKGKTGYPIVDAAMRELRETGWIHNGMRFLLACFLTKYLLLPWANGLKEFYKLLIDGDHSSNALGWQWTAGSNSDAFPVSCLVNPVKAAYRHDPTGSYVRRWLPELSKLPTELIHQPWKASAEILNSSGVELGKTYPHRIIQVDEARTRAMSAMRVMKQIFAGNTIFRGVLDPKAPEVIHEWPAEEPEVLQVDDSSCFSGKMSLLPSLWALLQCDQPSTYLSGSTTGTDPPIAVDTASLTEGALAVPLGDQHESIEHALISAHHQSASAATAIHDGVDMGRPLHMHSFENEKGICNEMPIPGESVAIPVDPLNEQIKYEVTNIGSSNETNKFSSHPMDASVPNQGNNDLIRSKNSSGTAQPSSSFPGYSNQPAASLQLNVGPPRPHYLQQPQLPQQFQSFQQLQQLQQFHQLQQFNLLQQQQHQTQAASNPSHLAQQQPQTPQLQQHTRIHSVIGSMYASGTNNGSTPASAVPTIPISVPMMGPTTNGVEANANTTFSGADGVAGMYGHQFGMGQFYGFHHVMPVANSHAMNGTERNDSQGGHSVPNPAKLTMPSMFPMGYGVYGAGMFDSSIPSGAFAASASPYGSTPIPSPQPTHTGSQNPYGVHSHPMYFGSAHNADLLPNQATGSVQHQSAVPGTEKLDVGKRRTRTSNNTTMAAGAAPRGRRVEVNVTPEAQHRNALKVRHVTANPRGDFQDGSRQFIAQLQGGEGLPSSGLGSSEARGSAGLLVRPNARSSLKTKTSVKSRRNSSNAAGRGRSSSKANASVQNKADSAISLSQQKSGKESIQHSATSLKTRQEMLAALSDKKDHEYNGFAQYLSITYELTGNTDRHTSKDYIRLCNLKDDYHKQCTSDKEKLKIYRIKAFFSKILKLEVTGEWDRHNHGGVRGPYVYGIRLRKSAEQSQDGSRS